MMAVGFSTICRERFSGLIFWEEREMKRVVYLLLSIGAAMLCLSAAPAHAQFQVTVAPGTPAFKYGQNGQNVGGAMTFTPADPTKPNEINVTEQVIVLKVDAAQNPTVAFIVDLHAIQTVAAGQAEVRIDRLHIINQKAAAVTSSITVQSDAFAATPVGPPFDGRVHLEGFYRSRGFIAGAAVSLTGSVLMPAPAALIGTVKPAAVTAHQPPVAFGPLAPDNLANAPFGVGPNKDATKTLLIGVTQLGMTLDFTLQGLNDAIVGPGSAVVAAYTADRTFTVNSTLDLPDGLPGDGVCDTGNATIGFTGICTLRAALTEADQQPVVTAIQFNIPGSGVPTIQMQSDTTFNFGSIGALQQVIIDGTTQPAGLVEVNGSQASPKDIAGNPVVGLDLVGQKSTVLGLVINNFPSHAIQIRPTGAPFGGSNVIEENAIGTDTMGLSLPNGGDGVRISQQPGNLILDNVIANSVGQGVSVDGSAATGNRIHANSINANGGGISLTNGANKMQSPPFLSSATEDGFNLTIGGTLHSAPNLTFNLDVFVNSQCDPSGSGEGERYLGSASAATDASGDATFTATLPADFSEGLVATATATDPDGNTSEFSACAAVQKVASTTQPPVANAGPNQTVSTGTLVMLNGNGSFDPNTPPLPVSFLWTQTAGPAVTLTGATTATPSFTPTQAGTYVFGLVVNNGVANSAAVSVTITVVTQSPQEQIQALLATVESLTVPDRLEDVLEARLNAALASLKRGNKRRTIHRLGGFIEEVTDHRGKKIPVEQADKLIAAAQQLINSIKEQDTEE
jgi:hypothetical protein